MHSRWAQLCLSSLPLSLFFSLAPFLFSFSSLFQIRETTRYTYTLPLTLNPFVCLAFPSRELMPDLHQPISDWQHLVHFSLFVLRSLSFSLWCARNISGHLCSRLTVENFFLFCRWIFCLLSFFSYFSFEINLLLSVST